MSDADLMFTADWSELPADLLGLIMDTLMKNTFFLLDYIRFGAVCVEWRSFLCNQNYEQIKLPSNLPLLLIPNSSQEDYYYYNNDDEDEYNHDDYDNPEEEEEEEDEQQQDDQQEPDQLQDYYLLKAFLSANTSSLSNPADLLVFGGVCGSNKFGFCRPGDRAWTYLPLNSLEREFRAIEDLICFKGRFLAIIQEGSVLELEFAHHLPEPSAKFIAETPTNGSICDKKYLVESGGDLLQVQRYNITDDYSTTGFRAFKLNEDADNDDDDKWVEMDNLDGRILFLGDNSSISLSAADFPGVMPNCIYFTDDNYENYESDDWDGPHDIGIFNFEDKSVVFDHDSMMMPPPIWIQPML